MMEARRDEQDILDDALLAAITPLAQIVEADVEGTDGPVFVSRAVVCFAYLNERGELNWGYRRVRADWFDVGGAAAMLSAAQLAAWLD